MLGRLRNRAQKPSFAEKTRFQNKSKWTYTIQPKHLRFRSPDAEVPTPPVVGIDEANPLPPAVEAMLAEQAQIRRALAENRGNIAKTARQLGLSRQALYRRLEKYGIQ